VLDTVSVLDALPGSIVTVSCTGPLCKPFDRRIVVGKRQTVFRDWRFRAPGFLTVVVGGRGVGTLTTITPRPHSGPAIATQCGGFPVAHADALRGRVAELPRPARASAPHHRPRPRLDGTDRLPRRRLPAARPQAVRRHAAHVHEPRAARVHAAPAGRVAARIRHAAADVRADVAFRVTRTTVERGPYRCLSRRVPLQPIPCPTAQQVTTGRGTAAPPTRTAHLPPLVPIRFRTVAKGDGTSMSRPRQANRDPQRAALAQGVGPARRAGEPPAIDFAREMLIAVTQGPQPSGGHAPRIRRIQPTGASVWRVSVSETKPGRGCPSTGVTTNPYHVVRVRRSAARARFERRPNVRACR
jgi:hypothetical protein